MIEEDLELERKAELFLVTNGCQRMEVDADFFEDVQPNDLVEFAKSDIIKEYWYKHFKTIKL